MYDCKIFHNFGINNKCGIALEDFSIERYTSNNLLNDVLKSAYGYV